MPGFADSLPKRRTTLASLWLVGFSAALGSGVEGVGAAAAPRRDRPLGWGSG